MNSHFQSFRLHPPHAPPSSGHTSCSGRAWPPIRFMTLSAVLRTSFIASSLISRIRPYRVCVAALESAAVLRTICSLPVALHGVSPRRSYFQLSGGKLRQGRTFTLRCALAPKRTSAYASRRFRFTPGVRKISRAQTIRRWKRSAAAEAKSDAQRSHSKRFATAGSAFAFTRGFK